MNMYSLYVSKSVLVVSFDSASSNRESVIQYASKSWLALVIPDAQRAQQHLYKQMAFLLFLKLTYVQK